MPRQFVFGATAITLTQPQKNAVRTSVAVFVTVLLYFLLFLYVPPFRTGFWVETFIWTSLALILTSLPKLGATWKHVIERQLGNWSGTGVAFLLAFINDQIPQGWGNAIFSASTLSIAILIAWGISAKIGHIYVSLIYGVSLLVIYIVSTTIFEVEGANSTDILVGIEVGLGIAVGNAFGDLISTFFGIVFWQETGTIDFLNSVNKISTGISDVLEDRFNKIFDPKYKQPPSYTPKSWKTYNSKMHKYIDEMENDIVISRNELYLPKIKLFVPVFDYDVLTWFGLHSKCLFCKACQGAKKRPWLELKRLPNAKALILAQRLERIHNLSIYLHRFDPLPSVVQELLIKRHLHRDSGVFVHKESLAMEEEGNSSFDNIKEVVEYCTKVLRMVGDGVVIGGCYSLDDLDIDDGNNNNNNAESESESESNINLDACSSLLSRTLFEEQIELETKSNSDIPSTLLSIKDLEGIHSDKRTRARVEYHAILESLEKLEVEIRKLEREYRSFCMKEEWEA